MSRPTGIVRIVVIVVALVLLVHGCMFIAHVVGHGEHIGRRGLVLVAAHFVLGLAGRLPARKP